LKNGVCKTCGEKGDKYLYIEENVCKEVCGKGMKLSNKIECDDGNLANGDGCNNKC